MKKCDPCQKIYLLEKKNLINLINENKKEHESIAKKLQDEEKQANEINKKLKLEEVKLNELREEKIRIEGIIGTIEETIKQLTDQVKERLGIALDGLFDLAKINPNKAHFIYRRFRKKIRAPYCRTRKTGGGQFISRTRSKRIRRKS